MSHLRNHSQDRSCDFPCFLLEIRDILGVKFVYLIHFELIVVYILSVVSNIILLQVRICLSQRCYLKRLCFPHCVVLARLPKIMWPYTKGLISGLSILSHSSICLSSCEYHTVLQYAIFSYCIFFLLHSSIPSPFLIFYFWAIKEIKPLCRTNIYISNFFTSYLFISFPF